MSRIFKVIAGCCIGKGKIFEYGQKVTESNFPPGNVDKLIARGFLAEIDEKGEIIKSKIDDADDDEKLLQVNLRDDEDPSKEEIEKRNNNLNPETDKDDLSDTEGKMKELGTEKIISDLTAANIKFDPNSSKLELYKLWLTID